MIHIDISKEYLSILNIPLCTLALDVYRRNLFTKQTSIGKQNGKEKLKRSKWNLKLGRQNIHKNMT